MYDLLLLHVITGTGPVMTQKEAAFALIPPLPFHCNVTAPSLDYFS